jgi:hypothetical protein
MPKSVEVFSERQRSISPQLKFELETVAKKTGGINLLRLGKYILGGIINVTDQLVSAGLMSDNRQEIEQGLISWLKDGEHGIVHSVDVFQGMMSIGQTEGLVNNKTDFRELAIRAGLHDLAEFLPIVHRGKTIDQTHLRRKHPEIMATLIKAVGKELGVSDTEQLATDILLHDAFYTKPTSEQMETMTEKLSPAGKLLADSDRLFGGGENIVGTIDRNRKGSLGKWYFLRGDLDNQDRLRWRPRTAGLFDGICALTLEFCAPEHWFYTDTAKKISADRRINFQQEATTYYQQEFIESWQLLNEAKQNSRPIVYGLRGANNQLIPIAEADLQEPKKFIDADINEKIHILLSTPVSAKSISQRQYYGYSLAVIDSKGDLQWLDPSILRFESPEYLQKELLQTIEDFSQSLKQQT